MKTYQKITVLVMFILITLLGCNEPTAYEELEVIKMQAEQQDINVNNDQKDLVGDLVEGQDDLNSTPDPTPDQFNDEFKITPLSDLADETNGINEISGINDTNTLEQVVDESDNIGENVDEILDDSNNFDESTNEPIEPHPLDKLRRPKTKYTYDPSEVCDWVNHTPDNDELIIGKIVREDYIQSEIQKLDILWVVDNSGSMLEEQDNLATNFQSFIGHMLKLEVDFQIAVTSTDVCSDFPDQYCPGWGYMGNYFFPQYTPLQGHFSGSTDNTILQDDDEDLARKFMDNVMLGVHGSGAEHGLTAAKWSIEMSVQPDSENYGFLREDSFLAVIFVSDEEDNGVKLSLQGMSNYYYTGDDFVEFLKSYRDESEYTVNAIVGMIDPETGQVCNNEDGQPVEEGKQYLVAAQKTGGRSVSICDQNFASSLETLGFDITSQLSQVILTSQPFPFTLRVYIDDEEVTDKIDYIEETNAVRFPPQYLPPAGANINITYYEASVPYQGQEGVGGSMQPTPSCPD